MIRKTLIAFGAVLAVLLSGAVATASSPVPAPSGLEGAVGTVQPVRVLDTRSGGPVAAGAVRSVVVTGAGDVPVTGVSAVVANVTVIGPVTGGFLTVWPGGATQPGTSNLNFVAGQTVPNLVVTKVGADGSIQIYNGSGGSVNVLVDVTGYVADKSQPVPAPFTVTFRGVGANAAFDGTSGKVYPDMSLVAPTLSVTASLSGGNPTAVPVGSVLDVSSACPVLTSPCYVTTQPGRDVIIRDSTSTAVFTPPGVGSASGLSGAHNRNTVDLAPYRTLVNAVNVYVSTP